MNKQIDHSTKSGCIMEEEEQGKEVGMDNKEEVIIKYSILPERMRIPSQFIEINPMHTFKQIQDNNNVKGVIESVDEIEKELNNLSISNNNQQQGLDTLGKELDGLCFEAPRKKTKIKKKKDDSKPKRDHLTKFLQKKKINFISRISQLIYLLFNTKSFFAKLTQQLRDFLVSLIPTDNKDLENDIEGIVTHFISIQREFGTELHHFSFNKKSKNINYLKRINEKLAQSRSLILDFRQKYFVNMKGQFYKHKSKPTWEKLCKRAIEFLINYGSTISFMLGHIEMLEDTCALQKNKMQNWSNYKEHQLSSN